MNPEKAQSAGRLQVVLPRVDSLRLHPRNPRTISERRLQQLVRTMTAHPDLLDARPLIALPDGTVVAGNMRLRAAQKLSLETIPTVFADLDENEATQWAFLDNRSFGEDDPDVAAELLAELQARGGDLDLTGFSRDESDALLRRILQRDKDPDELPRLPAGEPKSKLGEVYVLGSHRLMCGDATDLENVAELLTDVAPTLIVADAPYGIEFDNLWRDEAGLNGQTGGSRPRGHMTAGHETTSIRNDDRADWSDAYELVPSCTVIYAWHASRYACLVQAGLERVGFDVKQQIIWDKTLFALSRQHYHWQHEPCFYAQRVGARVPWFGSKNQSTIWQVPSPKMIMAPTRAAGDEKVDHPNQKPVALYSRPIENHLRPGETFYDPFAGSGTALIAAEQTGRRCCAMELDPRFCDLIKARYQAFTDGR